MTKNQKIAKSIETFCMYLGFCNIAYYRGYADSNISYACGYLRACVDSELWDDDLQFRAAALIDAAISYKNSRTDFLD